jgi:hypothetical protein
LFFLRQFATNGNVLDKSFIVAQRTRWRSEGPITFEIESVLADTTYRYRVVIDSIGEPPVSRVSSETVCANGELILGFEDGNVQLYSDTREPIAAYPFDASRSALATIVPRKDNLILTRFQQWLGRLLCFRINPFDMESRAEGETLYPDIRLAGFAKWYRHLVQANPDVYLDLRESLKASIDDFASLALDPFGDKVSVLFCKFAAASGPEVKVYFHELSDGQRCLICLYTILHFVLAKGSTVILDEPDNFLTLREIQPWLMRATDVIDEGQGQLIVISHHPEFINQWAPSGGVEFVRDGMGPVRVEKFKGDPQSPLSPAELIARGWERG